MHSHFAPAQRLVFELPHAHRGGVTAVAVSDAFIVSGGEDARVRVWTRRGRYEVVMEFAEHRRRVSKVHPPAFLSKAARP